MSYLDESGLFTYDSNLKEWISSQESKTITSSIYPWTKTAKAGAVSCYPVGGTELKPVVDFMFTEVPPASGDKGPDNPSTISGVSSVTLSHVGKNLLSYNFPTATVENGTTTTINGLTVTNTNGVYSISGTATKNTNISITNLPLETAPLKIMPGTYTLSGYTAPTGAPAGTNVVLQMNRDGVIVQTEACANGSSTFTLTGDTPVSCNVYIRTASGATYPSGFVCTPQLEQGGEATAFEPSYVTNYLLPLGSTYYGGSVDLSAGTMTVTWEATEITGAESWFLSPDSPSGVSNFYSSVNLPYGTMANSTGADNRVCSHFPWSTSSQTADSFFTWGMQSRIYIRMPSSSFPDVATFKSWLASEHGAGHPVTVCYLLGTLQTVQLTPPQILALAQTDKYNPRLNTIYTDASAVQVGYVKSPIREEFELQQAIVSQGGNI